MVFGEMGGRWKHFQVQLSCFALLILVLKFQGCFSLNLEGLALLEFRAEVCSDPYGVFADWNPYDEWPCLWSGVRCIDNKVHMLDLNGLSLEGTLSPELGKLTHLRSLVLNNNQFSGSIPNEIGKLTMLEVLDLRDNNFSGTIPAEIGNLQSLKSLLICNNNFGGSIPLELRKLNSLKELQFDEHLAYGVTSAIGCVNRKFGHCLWQSSLRQLNKVDSFIIPVKGTFIRYFNVITLFNFRKDEMNINAYNCCDNLPNSPENVIVPNIQSVVNSARRRLLEQSSNLAAIPATVESPSAPIIALPTARSSGSFPATPSAKKESYYHPTPASQNKNDSAKKPTEEQSPSRGSMWKYIIIGLGIALLLIAILSIFLICRHRAVTTIGPWKSGLSGQLQKAFVTGVPKLNRQELETACEDFSNIIDTVNGCTMYKGTLSSGVEIAVASTAITSIKEWSKRSEMAYRKKIDTLSRVNHKNFVNLIGYCEEDEPFVRMMVFEYAPNGNLFEHLHVKEVEHLDWNARTRIIMGTAYCLQYMHDLNPPVSHTNLTSDSIYLTDDYAAKIAEICFSTDVASKPKGSGDHESEHSELPPPADPETNVYGFGVLLLEIISGKVPHSEEHGPLVNWAAQYLNDKRNISCLVDPTLKSFKNNELEIICEVIQECIQPDARKRPIMKEVIAKLREVIPIAPDAATPRLSPLWWAELEILSAEAA